MTIKVTVSAEDSGARLDKFLAGRIEDISRTRIKALIIGGQVRLNGAVCTDPDYRVATDEHIEIKVPAPERAAPQPQDIPLDIVYEDADLLVIDKPAGLVVHPGAGNRDGTMVNALLHYCGGQLSGIGGVVRPGIVHRLDKETSGLIVVAKTDRAHQGLSAQLQERTLSRLYLAFVWKVPMPVKGVIDAPIGRHQTQRLKMSVRGAGHGREARTAYHVLETYGPGGGDRTRAEHKIASFVECRLETGRTHQIRVHMAHIGHPLIGDPLYGLPRQEAGVLLRKGGYPEQAQQQILALCAQALHAASISFIHPCTGEKMLFESALPAALQSLKNLLKTVC